MMFLIVSEYMCHVGGKYIAGICAVEEAHWNKMDPWCVLWGLQSYGGRERGQIDRMDRELAKAPGCMHP